MTNDETALFLASMGDVTPIKSPSSHHFSRAQQPNEAQLAKRQAAEQPLLSAEQHNNLSNEQVELLNPHDLLNYKRSGVQAGVFKNLRLAKYNIDATLDLHGQHLSQARNTVYDFIMDCQQRRIRVVLIRHGVGLKSNPQAILKSYVNKWLRLLEPVLAFHSALTHHGGSGSTYVLLKKSDAHKLENKERHAKR